MAERPHDACFTLIHKNCFLSYSLGDFIGNVSALSLAPISVN